MPMHPETRMSTCALSANMQERDRSLDVLILMMFVMLVPAEMPRLLNNNFGNRASGILDMGLRLVCQFEATLVACPAQHECDQYRPLSTRRLTCPGCLPIAFSLSCLVPNCLEPK